jgi:hypothetical protein
MALQQGGVSRRDLPMRSVSAATPIAGTAKIVRAMTACMASRYQSCVLAIPFVIQGSR